MIVHLLCRHAGQEEVVAGSVYHGRDAAGTAALRLTCCCCVCVCASVLLSCLVVCVRVCACV